MTLLYALILLGAIVTGFVFVMRKRDAKSITYEFKEDILTQKETDFLTMLNEYRQSKNLQLVRPDALAGLEAYKHNIYMIVEGKASHDGIDDRRENLFVHGVKLYNEIVAAPYTSLQGAYKAFLASPDHLNVIKNNQYNAVGVDIMMDDHDKGYYTIIFIKI